MKLSNTDFPREVRERMEQVLLPGDEILWAARPIPGWDSRLHEIGGSCNAPFMLLFTLASCGNGGTGGAGGIKLLLACCGSDLPAVSGNMHRAGKVRRWRNSGTMDRCGPVALDAAADQ